jgi:hypothetical protein
MIVAKQAHLEDIMNKPKNLKLVCGIRKSRIPC